MSRTLSLRGAPGAKVRQQRKSSLPDFPKQEVQTSQIGKSALPGTGSQDFPKTNANTLLSPTSASCSNHSGRMRSGLRSCSTARQRNICWSTSTSTTSWSVRWPTTASARALSSARASSWRSSLSINSTCDGSSQKIRLLYHGFANFLQNQ